MFLWWWSTKIVQAIWIRQKTWLPGGGAYFPYIIYIENFKNLYFRNHWTDIYITWQKCSLTDSLPRFSSRHDLSKNMAAGVRGLFSLYICLENFNDPFVRNHWTDSNATLQGCFFGNSLPRLFKSSWFIKNVASRGGGGGAYSSMYLNRKLK